MALCWVLACCCAHYQSPHLQQRKVSWFGSNLDQVDAPVSPKRRDCGSDWHARLKLPPPRCVWRLCGCHNAQAGFG